MMPNINDKEGSTPEIEMPGMQIPIMQMPGMQMNQQNICEPCMPMPKLARAYVPFQCMTCIYPPLKGLYAGTIFPELDRPYGVDPEYLVDA